MPEPEIRYPCEWGFRIIGTHDKLIRQLVAEVVRELDHTLESSNTSAGGKYVALHLRIEVRDEAHRNEIHAALMADEAVKTVL